MQEPSKEVKQQGGEHIAFSNPLANPQDARVVHIDVKATAAGPSESGASAAASGPSITAEVQPVEAAEPTPAGAQPVAAEQPKPAGGDTKPADDAKQDGDAPKKGGKKDEEKKEEKPIPSGIKPRGLILPVLALLVMSIPVLALCLPVYLTAKRDIRRAEQSSTSMCALFLYNSTSLDAASLTPYRETNQRECPGVLRQIENEDILYNDSSILQPNNFPVNMPEGQEESGQYVALVVMRVTSIDPQTGYASVSADISFAGYWTDERGRLQLGGLYTALNFAYLTATGGDRSLKPGDRATSDMLRVRANAEQSVFMYPFDRYRLGIEMSASLVAAGTNLTEAVPVVIKFETSLVGYAVSVEPSLFIGQTYVDEENSETYIEFSVQVKRSPYHKFFAVMVLIMMWIICCIAFNYGMDIIYYRPRKATNFDGGLFTALLFAMNGIRSAMPNVPPVGVGVDFYGFIWLMILVMLGASQMYCKWVAQYIHTEPTLYDKVAKTEAYTKWMEKKEKEEKEKAEKALKEKADKEAKEKVDKEAKENATDKENAAAAAPAAGAVGVDGQDGKVAAEQKPDTKKDQ